VGLIADVPFFSHEGRIQHILMMAMVDFLPQLRISEGRTKRKSNRLAVDGVNAWPSSYSSFIHLRFYYSCGGSRALLSFLNPPSASPCINMCRDGRKALFCKQIAAILSFFPSIAGIELS